MVTDKQRDIMGSEKILVQANKTGYFNNRMYHPGEKFHIGDESMLGSWMDPLTPGVKPVVRDSLSLRDRERAYRKLAAEEAKKLEEEDVSDDLPQEPISDLI